MGAVLARVARFIRYAQRGKAERAGGTGAEPLSARPSEAKGGPGSKGGGAGEGAPNLYLFLSLS
jgi:hypothetical protein